MAKRKIQKLTRKDVSAIIEMIRCRAYGHPWEDRGWVAMIKRSIRGYDQEFTCPRCSSTRTDFRARTTLKLISRSYTHHDNYPGSLKPHEALKIVIRYDTTDGADKNVEALSALNIG